MRDKTSMLSTDVPQDHPLDTSESLVLQKVRSFMCAPLWTEHDVFGVLYVDAPEEKRFSESNLDLFTTVSNSRRWRSSKPASPPACSRRHARRERLQRYHSPAVAERIVKQQEGDTDTVLEAQEREVTVLFADLVGFTTWSERMAPSEVAATLNAFFTAMTTVIFRVRGHARQVHRRRRAGGVRRAARPTDHALRAVQAAGAMREALARLNESQAQQLRMRLAVNSGIALVGDIGAPMRRDSPCSATSSTPPPACRVRSCEPDQILRSPARRSIAFTHGAVPATARGSVQVKGRVAAVSVYEI